MPEDSKLMTEQGVPDFSTWSCPLPLVGYPTIVMGHGGGGKLGNELVEHLFLPAFRNEALENLGDAAVSGAEPKFLSASFILEEGFPLSQLAAIVAAMADAAATAGVQIVTGDTKVVERGHGDGCYINTAGVGLLRAGVAVGRFEQVLRRNHGLLVEFRAVFLQEVPE